MATLEFDASAVSRPSFDRLPEAFRDLKSRRQWVGWKYWIDPDDVEGAPKKRPMCAHANFFGSHSTPHTWGTYEQAVKSAIRFKWDGVGYVLTADDDITGADLDKCRDPETGEIDEWARDIVALGETYVEISPSGEGLRLFWRGKAPKALKCDPQHVELYISHRYLTTTGDHLEGTPLEICVAPKTEAALQARVDLFEIEQESKRPALRKSPAIVSDSTGDGFFRKVNDAAIANLASWVPVIFPRAKRSTQGFRVSSRILGRKLEEDISFTPNGIVDFGVHDMGDGRQGKRTAIDVVEEWERLSPREAALWLCEQLGVSPHSLGWNEDDGHGSVLAAQLLETKDGLIDAETGEVIELPVPRDGALGELPDHLTQIPGLVGDITDWISDTALYPQRGLALGAALTIVGTAAGRHMSGPNRCGTHLYVVGLAPSGAGKNHPLSQIANILAAADMRAHIGPSQFISMPAVINFLVRTPLSVCAMDEFGSFLKRINNRRASGFEGAISGLLRSAWGLSFAAMSTPEWAQRSSETIFSPAMSIFGVSTAREFYDSLEGGDVTNGVLNRFLLIETKHRPKERAPLQDASQVPIDIVNGLKKIYHRDPIASAQLCQSRQSPPFVEVQITPDAEKIRRGLIDEIHVQGDANPTIEPFLARTAENALRLATIVSIGRTGWKPQIDAETMTWARDFSWWSTNRLAEGAGLYIADSDTQAAANAVRRAIQEHGGRVKRRDLIRALAHKYKTRDLDDVIKSLAEAESILIEKTVPADGGKTTFWYSIKGG